MADAGAVTEPGCRLCASAFPDAWVLAYVGSDPATEGTRETMSLTFRPAGGSWFFSADARMAHEHRALDLRAGLLLRDSVVVDREELRTRIR